MRASAVGPSVEAAPTQDRPAVSPMTSGIQRSAVRVGAADDTAERAADESARQVVARLRGDPGASAPPPPSIRAEPSVVRRKLANDEGLVDLGDGVRGEVGLPGLLKRGAVVTKSDASTFVAPVDMQCIVHELMDAKQYFVQVPGYVIGLATHADPAVREQASSESLENKRASSDRTPPVTGHVKRSGVRAGATKLTHKELKGTIFPHEPVPEDIVQIGLGNCYFLAALSSVVRRERDFVRDMIRERGDTVSVRFFRTQKETDDRPFRATAEYVTVKKSIAVDKLGRAKFTGIDSGAWPAIATKAYAAWSGHAKGALPGFGGSYQGTEGGEIHDALSHITGEPSSAKEVPKSEAGSAVLDDADLAGELIYGDPRRGPAVPWSQKLENPYRQTWYPPRLKAMCGIGPDADIDEGAAKQAVLVQVLQPAGYSLADVTCTFNKGVLRVQIDAAKITERALGLSAGDAQVWLAYLQAHGAELRKWLQVGTDATAVGAVDNDDWEVHLRAAQLSPAGTSRLRTVAADYVVGSSAKPLYNKRQIQMYDDIASCLARGGFVGADTPKYGGSGGRSGGEDVETVPGIAGGHAYSVVAVRADDTAGRRFVRLRNPWGNTGAEYAPDFSGFTETSDGEYDLELSDFTRYFKNVSFQQRRTPTTGELPNRFDIAKRVRPGAKGMSE